MYYTNNNTVSLQRFNIEYQNYLYYHVDIFSNIFPFNGRDFSYLFIII